MNRISHHISHAWLWAWLMAAAVGLCACSSDDRPAAAPAGRIAARAESEQTAELSLRLRSHDLKVDTTFQTASQLTPDLEFVTGSYTLEAFCGDAEAEGWDAPYYYGSSELEVLPDQVVNAQVKAVQQKATVTMAYTEAFRLYMASYGARLSTPSGLQLDLGTGTDTPAYVKAGNVRVDVDYVLPTGREGTFRAADFAAEAGVAYTVRVDVNSGQAGVAGVTVTLSDDMERESVDIVI